MRPQLLGPITLLIISSAFAQQPLAIPPMPDQDTFHLNVGQHTHQSYIRA